MRLALIASTGWLAVGAVLLGAPQLALIAATGLALYALWPEPCIDGHRLRSLAWAGGWSPWRCVRCGRLVDDTEPEWRKA